MIKAMSETKQTKQTVHKPSAAATPAPAKPAVGKTGPAKAKTEIGGPAGPEPTRYGDWEIKGRCIDF
jgi:hypothetical protein